MMRHDGTTRGWRWGAIGVVAALTLGACGGDDDDAGPADEPAADSAQSDAAQSDDAQSDDAQSDAEAAVEAAAEEFDFGTGVARVTLDGRTFEFDLTSGFSVCQEIFGGLQVAGQTSDGEANIDMWIPPTDWESYDDGRYDPPSIKLDDSSTNSFWIADPKRAELIQDWPAESRVDSYDKNGAAATGSASFVNDYAIDAAAPMTGTFEVACDS